MFFIYENPASWAGEKNILDGEEKVSSANLFFSRKEGKSCAWFQLLNGVTMSSANSRSYNLIPVPASVTTLYSIHSQNILNSNKYFKCIIIS